MSPHKMNAPVDDLIARIGSERADVTACCFNRQTFYHSASCWTSGEGWVMDYWAGAPESRGQIGLLARELGHVTLEG